MRTGPVEGWILAGTLDGAPSAPALREDVAGMPYVLRIACDLAIAGATRIFVVWNGGAPGPGDLGDLARDPRLARRAKLEVVERPPPGDDAEPILIARADRIFQREMPKYAAAAWRESAAPVAKVAGAEHDGAVVTDRATARRLAEAAAAPGGIAGVLGGLPAGTVAPPYRGFTMPAADRPALRRAERKLVWSLPKQAAGIASALINRKISLSMTYLLKRTPIRPNHVTAFCAVLGVAGGVVLAQGGYWAGVIGMNLVNLGSIIDGVDGELARLRYQYSRLGQWMDTLGDDLANFAYLIGLAINLHAAGVTWTTPLAITTLCAFAATQSTQYALVTLVYRSGDLAAIPWAFQDDQFLTIRPRGAWEWIKAYLPKTLKRDFALYLFVGFAIAGRLELILLVFSAGALSFFGVFFLQLVRNRKTLRRPRG